ncbi:MAG: efflux RND transporter permease subunit [Candidatus Polarisedimenticolia bacterium]
MQLIRSSIRFPVTTAVGVLLLALFGIIALFRLPIQLTPDVERPRITVETVWPGASPHEIEREIVDEQEEQLKSLEGLVKMESTSQDSVGQVVLTFNVGTPIDSALLKVSNRLQQVPTYPTDAEKPVIRSVDPNVSAMAWFVMTPTGGKPFEGDITTLQNFTEDFIKPEFERVPGVAASNIFGGREQEMQVVFDPERLAAHRLTLTDLGEALERENRNYSGGDFDEGKRRYVVRTVGEYASPEDLEQIVVAVRNGVPIYLRDVARAGLGYRDADFRVIRFGRPVLAMNAIKETGANVLDAMTGLKEAVARLNEGLLAPRGLKLVQVWDQTDYIKSAIDLVEDNLYIGGLLTFIVLMLFLRSVSSTLVVAVAMPVSLVATFLVMQWFGRTLNVVSLAGMAFSIGMAVDCSVVVLENIYRHRQMGKTGFEAAYEGTNEVWGAVLISTVTNIAVFIPVVFIQEEAGQLFGDIAIAVSASNLLSLLVSITVLPCLAARLLKTAATDHDRRGFHNLWGLLGHAERTTRWISDGVHWTTGSTARRLAVIVIFTGIPLALSWVLRPATDYLPKGDQNFLFGILLPPAGYNLEETASLEKIYQERLSPLWAHPAGSKEAETQPGGGIRDFFFVAAKDMSFMGVAANDPRRVRELIGPFMEANGRIPGAIAFIEQYSIFSSDVGEGGDVSVQIAGPELERLIALGGRVLGAVGEAMPGAQARPVTSLDLDNPEVRVAINRRRAAELGIANRDLGFAVRALVDGAKVSDYQHEGREIDLMLVAERSFAHRTHLLEQMPIAAPDGQLVTLGAVADVTPASGPVAIARRERQRSVTINVGPPDTMSLETAMQTIDAKILAPMRESGDIGGLYHVNLTGSAEKLVQARRSVSGVFLLAVAITYLLMAALFESFLYPFIIMLSVPLAGLGGVLGLAAVNLLPGVEQNLDIITMLGFIILVGTVVNNAILIVHQSLNHMRDESMPPREAIREATRTRIRPIFMSVGASVIGMLPLVLFPGAGSELYRGLGSVVTGGLIVSTLFTLYLVPAMFSLSLDLREALLRRLRRWLGPPAGAAESAGGAVTPGGRRND